MKGNGHFRKGPPHLVNDREGADENLGEDGVSRDSTLRLDLRIKKIASSNMHGDVEVARHESDLARVVQGAGVSGPWEISMTSPVLVIEQ